MPLIELRLRFGEKSPGDLVLTISEKTYDYLLNTAVPTARVSSYLDRDWPKVEANYEELFVNEECPTRFRALRLSPGSKTRWTVTLPDEMKEGEQLTIQVARVNKDGSKIEAAPSEDQAE